MDSVRLASAMFIFCCSPEFAWFIKSTHKKSVGTLHVNRKSVPPIVKDKKLKKGEHCGQHSGDVVIHACQDRKQVTTVSTYHKTKFVWL